jgi:predicted nucleic-acid-binding Zn-ribbon protein
MWKCLNCSELVESSFDACWNCGTSSDGIPDPEFVAETEFVATDEPDAKALESEIAKRFQCAKCSHNIPSFKRISATGIGLSKLIDLQHNQFLVVSCVKCGYSELYDSDILGSFKGVGNLLDLLFGS